LPKTPSEWNPGTPAGLAKVLSRTTCKADGDYERLKKEIKSIRQIGDFAKTCLITFQKQYRKIPELEHGMAFGAITLWYLTQAAKSLQNGNSYAADSKTKKPAE